MTTPLNDDELKIKIAILTALCMELYPTEFPEYFIKSREEFRDWLNGKTSLNVDHIADKSGALLAWIAALQAK